MKNAHRAYVSPSLCVHDTGCDVTRLTLWLGINLHSWRD